ncbi:salivaricin M family lantibiotic [Streptococcus equinus]|uniref:salivaricin M family lantibiotic n=1 Tax=Streptococcus equinus TaxID=1335 RepID=UPI0037CD4DED
MTEEKFGIDTLEYEINHQELDGESAAGARTAIRMTAQGRCGYIFTTSYECTSPNVRCG